MAKQLRFRGGTALPLRYSEDIDLVKTVDGPLKPLLDLVHDIFDPWLGDPVFERCQVAPKFKYSTNAGDKTSQAPIRLKLEINTSVMRLTARVCFHSRSVIHGFQARPRSRRFQMRNGFRPKSALLQRNKGRDLIDLSHAPDVFPDFDAQKTIFLMGRYFELSDRPITRPQAEQRMFAKLARDSFLADVVPLLTADEAVKFDATASRRAFASAKDDRGQDLIQ